MEVQIPVSSPIPSAPPPVAPVSPPPSAPVPPAIKKETSPILLAILGLLIVAGVAFAGLTLWQKGFLSSILSLGKPSPTPTLAPGPTPTPDPTANWETYTNAEFEYSIKCPLDSGHKVEMKNGDGKKFPYLQEICFQGGNQVRVSVFKMIDFNGFSKEYIENENSGASLEVVDFKEFEIGGQKSISYKTKNKAGQIEANIVEIMAKKDNIKIFIRGFSDSYFNQILSTFKFLDQTSSIENWKEYVNTEDNYSVKYPPIWFSRGRVENTLGGSESYLSNEDTKYVGLSKKGVYIFIKKKGRTENDSFYFKQAKETKGAENLTVGGQPAVKVKARTANMSGMGDQERYVIETTVFYKNQTLYAISLESPFVKPIEENEKIYDQILSTFEFIQ
jgi:hypothetical protein